MANGQHGYCKSLGGKKTKTPGRTGLPRRMLPTKGVNGRLAGFYRLALKNFFSISAAAS